MEASASNGLNPTYTVSNSQAISQNLSLPNITAELKEFTLKDGQRRLSGAARKRYSYHRNKGVAPAEALKLAALPINETLQMRDSRRSRTDHQGAERAPEGGKKRQTTRTYSPPTYLYSDKETEGTGKRATTIQAGKRCICLKQPNGI